jgi:hypothetical protein
VAGFCLTEIKRNEDERKEMYITSVTRRKDYQENGGKCGKDGRTHEIPNNLSKYNPGRPQKGK